MKNGILTIAIILSATFAFGQGQDTLFSTPFKPYVKSYFTNSFKTITAPVRWNAKNWIIVGGSVAITATLFNLDEGIQKISQEHETKLMSDISGYGLEPWGSGLYTLPAIGLLYGSGWAGKSPRLRKTALNSLQAWGIAGAFVYLPKISFGRHRPYQTPPPDAFNWDGPFSFTYKSFPSGHTITVFAAATVIASEYKDKPWVPAICYSIASLTGISRIIDNKHWASDVFMGAMLGYGIGKLVHNNNCKWTIGSSVPGQASIIWYPGRQKDYGAEGISAIKD